MSVGSHLLAPPQKSSPNLTLRTTKTHGGYVAMIEFSGSSRFFFGGESLTRTIHLWCKLPTFDHYVYEKCI